MEYYPCEASEQKLGQKTKSELKEIELSYCPIRFVFKNKHLGKKTSKLDEK